jgi:hypothetical protein
MNARPDEPEADIRLALLIRESVADRTLPAGFAARVAASAAGHAAVAFVFGGAGVACHGAPIARGVWVHGSARSGMKRPAAAHAGSRSAPPVFAKGQ